MMNDMAIPKDKFLAGSFIGFTRLRPHCGRNLTSIVN